MEVAEMEKYINEKISKLPIHRILKQTSLGEFFWDFDNVSFYPSAMWDEKSKYPSIETGYAFTDDMNDELFEKIIDQTFTQSSAILKVV